MKIEDTGIEIGNFNRNQMTFTDLDDAKIQAIALSMCNNDGRWKVYRCKYGKYHVQYDECKVRDGVDDDFIFESCSDCNSGTWEYRDAKIAAAKKLYEIL